MSVFAQGQSILLAKSAAKRRESISLAVTAREALWIALEALRAHKLRSFLTLLGVVIATTTLIVVMSVVNGMNLYIAEHVANLGVNTFVLDQFQWGQTWEEFVKAQRTNRPIRMDDYEFLTQNVVGAKTIAASAGLGALPDVRYQNHVMHDVAVAGVTPNIINVGSLKVELGRFFTDADYDHNAMVCFIGNDLANEFFAFRDPLGKEIMVGGLPFRVIGTAQTLGTSFGQSQDTFLQIPLSTFQKTYQGRPELSVSVQAWDSGQMGELEDQVRALMRARRHVPYHDSDPFGINASATLMATWQALTGTIFGVTIGVVAVFMVIGGIVIMNIMLASVTERTHEIGIRKSLGARRRDILLQFVIESAAMALAGGVLGVLLASGIAQLVNLVFTASVPLSAVVVGVVLSSAVGLFFGIYPASKAAKLDPIEALRTEK
ncbi:MAG TPA: ABC transporter permease [Terriglobia bacterium]|nr:ABC transporter permease [Terriglobia bacterium]